MAYIPYKIHPQKKWLAAIEVEDFPDCDPSTDEGKEDLSGYASMIFFENRAIQHVVIRKGGKVIGEVASAGSAVDPPVVH